MSQPSIFEIAETQHGYFTSKQAAAAGYTAQLARYHCQAGNWHRPQRGIYRLNEYPRSEVADLALWQLWSRNRADVPQGVFSHETALSLYDLSDAMPAKLHMTVPPGFDRFGETPAILRLHRAKLDESEITTIDGIRVTRPLRTVLDLVAEGATSPDLIRQAIRESDQRGLFAVDDLRTAVTSRRTGQALRRTLKGLG